MSPHKVMESWSINDSQLGEIWEFDGDGIQVQVFKMAIHDGEREGGEVLVDDIGFSGEELSEPHGLWTVYAHSETPHVLLVKSGFNELDDLWNGFTPLQICDMNPKVVVAVRKEGLEVIETLAVDWTHDDRLEGEGMKVLEPSDEGNELLLNQGMTEPEEGKVEREVSEEGASCSQIFNA
jgi:hypothetical protein